MKLSRVAAILCVAGCLATAHESEPLRPHDLWSAWPLEPGILVSLLLPVFLYARGARTWRGVSRFEQAAFWCGMVVVAIALASPLHPLGEALFSAHMAQHEILILIAAPLLVLSRPLTPLLWGLPMGARRAAGKLSKLRAVQSVWTTITRPLAAWWIHAAALWVWHAPAFFLATLQNEWVHTAQHLSFFLSALLFWWALFHGREHGSYGHAVFYVFTTAIHTSILGALLTFSNIVIYPAYSTTAPLWRLTPLEDQQIGGLIMWVPAGIVYIVAGLLLFRAWLAESDVMADRRSYAD